MAKVMYLTKAQLRLIEWVVVGGLLAACAFGLWLDGRRYPDAVEDWTVEPIGEDGAVRCPPEFPQVVRIDYEREVVTCATETK